MILEVLLGDLSGKKVLNIKLLFSHSAESDVGTTERSLESSREAPSEILLLRRLGESFLSSSGGTNNVANTTKDTWKGTNASTDETSPAHFLFSTFSGFLSSFGFNGR